MTAKHAAVGEDARPLKDEEGLLPLTDREDGLPAADDDGLPQPDEEDGLPLPEDDGLPQPDAEEAAICLTCPRKRCSLDDGKPCGRYWRMARTLRLRTLRLRTFRLRARSPGAEEKAADRIGTEEGRAG